MRGAREKHDDDDMGMSGKLTLGLLIWKTTKGLVKLGAMVGAAVLGWRLVRGMLERSGSSTSETAAVA
jgi:hypothetical protein